MPKYLITTCPRCKKEFEEKVFWVDEVISPLDDYQKNPDGIYTRRMPQKPKPRIKNCPFCKKSINMDDPNEYKFRYEEKNDPPAVLKKRCKGWFSKFLP